MKKILFAVLFISVILCSGKLYSQDSDAGVCFIGKKSMEMIKDINSLSLGYNYGYSGTANNIFIHTFKLEGDFKISNNVRFEFGMPFSITSGALGDVAGQGDLIAAADFFIPARRHAIVNFILGGKFATGKVNTADSLPLAYMPGLGTNDLLIGAGYSRPNFNLAAGFQKTFGTSANTVTRIKRGDDLFLRAGYNEDLNKINLKTEVEIIMKVQLQTIQSSPGGTFYTVNGSNQTQVNLTGQLTYNASENFDILAYAIIPLLKRDYNYDGLKRSFSAGLSVDYLFNRKKK